jgi:hypothetical protein
MFISQQVECRQISEDNPFGYPFSLCCAVQQIGRYLKVRRVSTNLAQFQYCRVTSDSNRGAKSSEILKRIRRKAPCDTQAQFEIMRTG